MNGRFSQRVRNMGDVISHPHVPTSSQPYDQNYGERDSPSPFARLTHIHNYELPADKRAVEWAEYLCLVYQLAANLHHLPELAQDGQMSIGTASGTKEVPLSKRQGCANEIISVQGTFGEIHVLIPRTG